MDNKIKLNKKQSDWLFDVLATYQWWTDKHMSSGEYIRMDDIHKEGYYFEWDKNMLNDIRGRWIQYNPYKK